MIPISVLAAASCVNFAQKPKFGPKNPYFKFERAQNATFDVKGPKSNVPRA